MSWKGFAAGIGAGVAATVLAKNALDQKETLLSPEKALKLAKKKAADLGTVEGSWVHMMTEQYEHGNLIYDVYKGGITVSEPEGTVNAYEFYVDAPTGTIIELVKQD